MAVISIVEAVMSMNGFNRTENACVLAGFVPPSTIILLLTYLETKAYRWNSDILDVVQVWTEEEFRRIQHAL
ncbi:hypothetical protein Tco_1280890 [Tanacetum coccineum]